MSDEMTFAQNEDGTFSAYNNTYDITIHCEMQFKMVRTLNLVQNSAILGTTRYVDTDVVKM